MSGPLAVAVGLVSGVLSGLFGIGGGLVTTPAIRLLLGYPALIAVGTPLPVILPTALAGALSHARARTVDVRAGAVMGAAGVLATVAGAWATRFAGGRAVLLLTAVLIAVVAVDMAAQELRRGRGTGGNIPLGEEEPPEATAPAPMPAPAPVPTPAWQLALVGLVAGLYSGFLGLGGGFVVVPALTRWLKWPLKRAIGTSLVTVSLLAVPGTITHFLLGHVDPVLALWLIVGTVPGALLGARLNRVASERHLGVAFAVMLGITGLALGVNELRGWLL